MTMSPAGVLQPWQLRALVFTVVAAAGGYLAFSLWGGWEEVLDAFSRIGIVGALLALAMSLVNYGLRFVRWQAYLKELGHAVATGPSLRIYLSGFALTTTPGKAGEAFRGFLLRQHGVPFPSSFAAFISERLSDLVAIVLLTLLGLTAYPPARELVLLGVVGVAVVVVAISSERVLQMLRGWGEGREGRLHSMVGHLGQVLLDARRCHQPGLLVIATLLSLLAWGAEAVAFHWVLEWLDADIALGYAVFVYALSMLAGALSFMPGGLGGAEAVMVSLLVLAGLTMPDAVAATVFIRLATLWFAVLIGLVALIMSQER